MNTPKVRSLAPNSNLYMQKNNSILNYVTMHLKNNTKLCIHFKKTTAKLSLALFLGISYFLIFFWIQKFNKLKQKMHTPKREAELPIVIYICKKSQY